MTIRHRLLVMLVIGLAIVPLNVALLLTRPALPVVLAAVLSLAAFLASCVWLLVDVLRARQIPPPQRLPIRTLDQEKYAKLLRGDVASRSRFRALIGGGGAICLRCKRGGRFAKIYHPIWDGPFDEAGSGSVDVRLVSWCRFCDGPPPDATGAAVRLPYLDYGLDGERVPIRLLPELYERPAFRHLPAPVELYTPPPPAPEAP